MTDQNLSDLLDRAGERIAAGSPPLGAMIDAAAVVRRRQRTRWTGALAAVGAGAVVAVVVGGPALFPAADSRTPPQPSTQGTSPVESEPIPPGTRLVGIGHVAIAVPEEWATNAIRCGTATRPTVVVDVTVIEGCALLAPKVHDVVWLERAVNASMFVPDRDVEIDGVAAQTNEVTCSELGNGTTSCTRTVFVPSDQASFRAIAKTKERVDEILSWIRVVDDRVAVPGFHGVNDSEQDDDAGEHYRQALQAAGLAAQVNTQFVGGGKPGLILGVSPAPGTMLEPGQTVTMTEVADPRGPADLVDVEVNSVGPGNSMDYRGRTDAQLRAGTRIELELGSTIWVYGHGQGIGSLAGEISGPALALDDWREGPNYGRSWTAVARGTSELTVIITVDGERIVIGTVTVSVR